VEFSSALAAQLATLGRAAAELPDAVDELHRLLLALVPSAVGLSTTVLISDVDLTLTTVPEGVKPVTSLRVPLSLWTGFEAGSQVVFYASTAGSLVDLAAELGAPGLRVFGDTILIADGSFWWSGRIFHEKAGGARDDANGPVDRRGGRRDLDWMDAGRGRTRNQKGNLRGADIVERRVNAIDGDLNSAQRLRQREAWSSGRGNGSEDAEGSCPSPGAHGLIAAKTGVIHDCHLGGQSCAED